MNGSPDTPTSGDDSDAFADHLESVSEGEVRQVEERRRLRAPIIHEIVREEGEEELLRPLVSLWWSSVTAGVAISLSLVAQGLLHRYLPAAPWSPLIEKLGYSVGFLVVIFGRLQLFTENTITAVLPLMAEPSWRHLVLTLRLWSIVFVGNILGVFLFSLAAVHGGLFSSALVQSFLEIARQFMDQTVLEMALFGVPAGFLIAVLVWILPSAEGNAFWLVMVLTYLVGLGSFAHVVVGASDAFLLLMAGEIGPWRVFADFMAPSFLGNVVGGTVLFAVLAHTQVREEL